MLAVGVPAELEYVLTRIADKQRPASASSGNDAALSTASKGGSAVPMTGVSTASPAHSESPAVSATLSNVSAATPAQLAESKQGSKVSTGPSAATGTEEEDPAAKKKR